MLKDLIQFSRRDDNIIGLRFLDFQSFIDQIAQNLQSRHIAIFFRNPADITASRSQNQSKALLNIRIGNDGAIDDSRRFMDIRVAFTKNRHLLR